MNLELKTNANPENLGEHVTNARKIAHKAVLAYAGMWGMAYDSVKYGLENSQELLEKAEKRGEEMERELTKWYDSYVETAGSGINKLRGSYDESMEGVKDSVVGVRDSMAGVRESVTDVRKSVGNVRDVVAENTKGLQEAVASTVSSVAAVRPGANGKKDVPATVIEVARDVAEDVTEALSAPFDGYDELTAKELVGKLEKMDDKALELVKSYEEATKNRVTVLREIDARMEKAPA